MSINRGLGKEDVVHIDMVEYYLAIKKEWNSAVCSNMNGPRERYTEWSNSENEEYRMTFLICRI